MAKAEVIVHLDESARMTFEARITELETEQGELHRELARLRSQLATAREDASEMEKKAIAEGSEALALRAEVAALKAAAQWRLIDGAPKDGSRVLVGNGRNSPVFARFIDRQWRSDESPGIVRPSHYLPIPAFPSGDGQ